MKKRHQSWPNETLGFRADILEHQERILPLLEVCLDEGIIRQRYSIIEMLLPSIDEHAHQIVNLSRTIRQYATSGRQGRPPKWLEITEDIIAQAIEIVDCIREIRQQMRAGRWGTVATYLKVCLKLSSDIGEQLQIVESEPVPRIFYEGIESDELKPGRWRRRSE